MKIVQIANTLAVSDGGPARNSFELNVTLNEFSGVESQLIWMRGDLEDSVIDTYDGSAGAMPFPGPQRFSFRTKGLLRRIGLSSLISRFRESDVVIIHGYYLSWILPAAILFGLLRVPFVITPHGALTRHQRGASRNKKMLYELAAGQLIRVCSRGFVTGSQVEANEILEVFPKSKVFVTGVGTPMPNNPRIAKSWGVPLRILSLSRISHKKRIDLSIQTVCTLRDRGIDARLDVVGAGDSILLAELKDMCRDLEITDRVTFHGEIVGAEKRRITNESDLYILPSDDENFGISLAEALAAGLPAIASSNVASSFAISGDAGRVINRPNPSKLADAIMEIVAKDAASASNDARACAEASYSWRSVAKRWINCVEELSGRDTQISD